MRAFASSLKAVRPLTKADYEEMRRLYREGKTLDEIAPLFGVTRQAIAYHVKGIKKGGATKRAEDRNKRIRELFHEGKSCAEIAIATGLSALTVSNYVHMWRLHWKQR